MTTKVLFMCPHAAGKSLAAATYARAAGAREGLDLEISVAGPDPDDAPMPNVVEALTEQGFTIGWLPKRVTDDDVDGADIVVSIGCDASELPTSGEVAEWDVPMISADLPGSLRAIHRRVEALVADLAAC